jgi:hypothetical protein
MSLLSFRKGRDKITRSVRVLTGLIQFSKSKLQLMAVAFYVVILNEVKNLSCASSLF